MSFLRVSNIHKKIKNGFHLDDIGFVVDARKKIAIAGTTGSGKTTLLKIIAGLVQADSGQVYLKDEKIKGPEEQLIAGHPEIGYLSQHFELRNHYRVEEVLDYANHLNPQRAKELYALCRVDFLLNRWTTELSGGEKQRVALARILTGYPSLLLLDEPFSNLDLPHKLVLKEVIRDIGAEMQITTLLVSHEAADILPWADEIFILKEGVLIERGTAPQLYLQPDNLYTAALLGKYNLLTPALANALDLPAPANKNFIMCRPEHLAIGEPAPDAVLATVKEVLYLGFSYELRLQTHHQELIIHHADTAPAVGSKVQVMLAKAASLIKL